MNIAKIAFNKLNGRKAIVPESSTFKKADADEEDDDERDGHMYIINIYIYIH